MPMKIFEVFIFFCLCSWSLAGVFGDEVKSVSVTEGDSVTLNPDLTEIQKMDLIMWKFGPNDIIIARGGESRGQKAKVPPHPCSTHEPSSRPHQRRKQATPSKSQTSPNSNPKSSKSQSQRDNQETNQMTTVHR